MHDLENKKRRSIEFLKTFQTLKFFMKVNVYDPENVQKGRLILLNIAEDLKEYAKITVSPGGAGKSDDKVSKKGEKNLKDSSVDEIEQVAEQRFVTMGKDDSMDMDDESGDFDLASKSYIYLELESTTNFKDIDVDAMLEKTSMDDFMRGLYTTGIEKGQAIKQSNADDETKNVMQALLTGVGLDQAGDQQEVKLDFDMSKTQESTLQDED